MSKPTQPTKPFTLHLQHSSSKLSAPPLVPATECLTVPPKSQALSCHLHPCSAWLISIHPADHCAFDSLLVPWTNSFPRRAASAPPGNWKKCRISDPTPAPPTPKQLGNKMPTWIWAHETVRSDVLGNIPGLTGLGSSQAGTVSPQNRSASHFGRPPLRQIPHLGRETPSSLHGSQRWLSHRDVSRSLLRGHCWKNFYFPSDFLPWQTLRLKSQRCNRDKMAKDNRVETQKWWESLLGPLSHCTTLEHEPPDILCKPTQHLYCLRHHH